MSFLSSLFSKKPQTAAPATAKPTGGKVSFDVPAALPKLTLPEEMEAKGETVDPAAHLTSLLDQQKAAESVEFLAASLPEKDAVRWACDSCALVSTKMSPGDQAALDCCKTWVAEPTAANGKLAGAAAASAGHNGPGAWAAQAAAWAETTGVSARVMSPLIAKAVTGSIMLAAALSKPGVTLPAVKPTAPVKPADVATELADGAVDAIAHPPPAASAEQIPATELCRTYKPFLDKGIAIAAG